MKNVFSFCNQKGGVGKTTSVINIAASISEAGYKTLILDLDSQANATSGLGEEKPSIEFTAYQLIVENHEPVSLVRSTQYKNLFLIPSGPDLSAAELELMQRERREYCLQTQLKKISPEYDFIFIDCPPSLNLVTVNALTASDYIIIPLQCEYYALEGLSQLLNTYYRVQKNLNPELEIGGVILTMADSRTNLTHQVIEEVKEFFKEKTFQTPVSRSVKISEAPSFGKPAVFYDPSNRASKNYKNVAEEFLKRFASHKIKETQETNPVESLSVSVETASQEGGLS